MATSDTQRELELQTLITQQLIIQAKTRREAAGFVAEAQTEYEANLGLLAKQNKEIEKYDRGIRVARDNTAQLHNTNSQGATESSSLMSKLTGTVATFNDETFNAAKRLYDLADERRALTESVASTLGGSSRIFNMMGQNAKSASELVDSSQRNVTGKLREYYKEFGEVAGTATKDLTDSQLKFVAQVNSSDRAFLNAQAAMDSFYRASSGYKQGPEGQFLPDTFFMVQGVPLDIAMGSKEKAFEPFLDILKDETLTQPFAKKMLDPAAIDDSMKELKRINVAITGLGMQSRSVTDLVRTNFIRTGEATTSYFDEVVKAAEVGQNAFGYSANVIVSDVYKMTQNIETFGFRSGDEFAKIAARAKDLHMTIEDVQSTMGKFDTFESAAQTVGQLNAALGTNYDALELMTLKYEDPALMIEKLREGLQSTGKSFDEIPIAYRRMMTQQLGITMEGLRGLSEGNVRSLDEMTAQQDKARQDLEGGLAPEQAQAALDARLEQRFKISNSMLQDAQDAAALAERVGKTFAQDGLRVSEMAERTKDAMHILGQTYTKTVAPAVAGLAKSIASADDALAKGGVMSATKIIESQLSKTVTETAQTITKFIFDQLEAVLNQLFTDSSEVTKLMNQARGIQPTAQVTNPTEAAHDVVMKGELDEGDRVVLSNYGSILRSTLIDKRDTLVASPTMSKAEINEQPNTSAPRPTTPLPVVSDTIRASLQSAGSSLRIELDVGQLTDLVLRDIMMNKPNVFGGIG